MKEIIAMHGWAGDSKQWSNWIDYFQCCDWEWHTAERGYKNISPHKPRWKINVNQSTFTRVAICHSLGSHLIDKHVLSSATHVVLINSFSRFIPSGKQNRAVKMALDRMLDTINTPNESSMIKKFHIKALKPNDNNLGSKELDFRDISDSGRVKLKNDLKLLMNSDSLPAGLNSNSKVLVINSEKDYILASQTKEKLTEDLKHYLETSPTIINAKEEGHFISKVKNIKKIKHWLESEHAKNMV